MTMISLLDQWGEVCNERSDLDKSNFLGLLKNYNSLKDLNKIFSHFPHSHELASRAATVLQVGQLAGNLYLAPPAAKDDFLLIDSASGWLETLKLYFQNHGNSEFFDICNSVKVELIDSKELQQYYLKDTPSKWFFDFISDEVRSSRAVSGRKKYYLYEALYGLSGDYYIAYYIMQPVIKLDLDFEMYFNFWKAGGKGVITEDVFFVAGA